MAQTHTVRDGNGREIQTIKLSTFLYVVVSLVVLLLGNLSFSAGASRERAALLKEIKADSRELAVAFSAQILEVKTEAAALSRRLDRHLEQTPNK